ncbi:MAG: zinc-ribbon domain-containing protein [Candidatus Hodarchaeales archaeon]|jgi:uncharacterized RDD family membrane protein YckC
MKYCPQCGNEIKEDDRFCGNCGYQIPLEQKIEQPVQVDYQPKQPTYASPSYQEPPSYPYEQRPVYQQVRPPHTYNLGPLGDRCVASCIDSLITSGLSCFLYVPGICYAMFKDGINQGQSIGKSAMNLRVIDYNTGLPASYGQSCIRNCCDCCICWVLVDTEGRRIGDHFAGTIVVKDE